MAVERRDPLPAGRYSIFINADEGARFAEWRKANAATVKVVSTIDRRALETTLPGFATRWDGTIIESLVGTSILFDVSAPTPWVGLGFPTIEQRPSGAPRSVGEWSGAQTSVEEAHQGGAPDVFDRIQSLILLGGAALLGVLLLSRPKGQTP